MKLSWMDYIIISSLDSINVTSTSSLLGAIFLLAQFTWTVGPQSVGLTSSTEIFVRQSPLGPYRLLVSDRTKKTATNPMAIKSVSHIYYYSRKSDNIDRRTVHRDCWYLIIPNRPQTGPSVAAGSYRHKSVNKDHYPVP